MKKTKIISLILIIAVLVLEILPYGAVCNFIGDPEANITIRHTYSYFDLTPYGYANLGPFLTAILSCILTILIVVPGSDKVNLNKPIAIISAIAVITSLMPLLYGLNFYSFVGALITLLLSSIAIIHFRIKT